MKTRVIIAALCGLFLASGLSAQSVWDREHLSKVKLAIGDEPYREAYKELIKNADALLDAEPLSVMMKDGTAASGDKHDYLSQARYYWPDPSKPDGLPYISRDGESNPEINRLDRIRLGDTAERVETLALAWFFSGDEKYARKATELIRVWFLNKDTRMNPNLEYAQVARGHNNDKGRCYGLIDTYSFVEMLDAVALLESSRSFTVRDSRRLKSWFTKLTEWMLTSEQGRQEAAGTNNHSVAYDAQVIAFALYTGNDALAEDLIRSIPQRRLFKQVEPDGSQPWELRRTLAFHYSQYNLTHFIDIMLMGRKLGIEIDKEVSPDGRSFYKAMDFLTPYVGKSVEDWPYKQISGWNGAVQNFCKDLYRTASCLAPERRDYLDLYFAYRVYDPKDRFNLLYLR